jgi:hypothetical protein
MSGRTGHVRCVAGVQLQDKGLQLSTTPNPIGQLMWHAPDTEQCHVRCTTELSGAPSTATARIVVDAINTLQPLPFKLSKFSELHIHCKSKKTTLQDIINRSNPLQASKSTQFLSDLREGVFCSFVALVAWIAFSFSFLFSKCFVKLARDT